MVDKKELEEVVEKNSRYVYDIINRDYPTFKHDMEDLYQSGVLGLLLGYKNYDPHKGEITTRCVNFIKGEINKQASFFMGENSVYYGNLHKRVKMEKRRLEESGQEVTVEKIMEATNLSKKIVKRELALNLEKVSYEEVTNLYYADSCSSGFEVSDEAVIDAYCAGIDEKTREIIRMRALDAVSFSKIAKQLGTSKVFVEKLYEKGIENVKKNYLGAARSSIQS